MSVSHVGGSYPPAMFSLWLRSSMEEMLYWLSSSTRESRLQQSTFSSLEKHTNR